MTLRCPRCQTLYRRPARAEETATFRCAGCGHVFSPAGVQPDLPPADLDQTADESERFRFDDERFEAGPFEAGPFEAGPAPEAEAEVEEVTMVAPETAPRRGAASAQGPSAARFAVRTCLLVTLGYAALSLYLYAQPEAALHGLRGVPVIGARLAETRIDPAIVELRGVRGEYRRVSGDQLVFVVTGTAVNRARVAVQGIQVEGFITGVETRRQIVFCGAALRDVQDLSLREIALLQTIEPPRGWTLPPGDSATCRLVFSTPPADLREFGVEVVAVRAPASRAARAGTPPRL